MAETPALPTFAQFVANMQVCDHAPYAQVAAVVDILQRSLPDMVDDVNTAKGWSGTAAIPAVDPLKIHVAPTAFDDSFIDSIAVGYAFTMSPHGVGVYKTEIQLVIYVIGNRITVAQNVADLDRKASVIKGIMHHYQGGYYSADDQTLWSALQPSMGSFVTEKFEEYAGVALTYTMTAADTGGFWNDLEA
jgi:hypothetical protein